jgi:hypothetical protein
MAIRRWIVVEIVLVLFAASTIAGAVPGEQNREVISNVRTARGAAVRKQIQVGTVAGEKTVVRGDIGLRKIAATAKETELRANEYIVARWADKEVKIPPVATQSGNAWSVGFGFIGIAPDGREIRFRPVIESAGGLALRDAGKFQGRIFVGLRDNKDPAASYPLPQPVSLLVSGQADELLPRQFSMDHTNLPFTEITIASNNPTDPTEFTLIAAGTSERATINLPVVRPRLEVVPARSQIQGLGLETSTVSVRAVGLPDPMGRVVTVSADFASVDPTQVFLDAHGVGTTTVRSVSFGQDSIKAQSPPLASAAVPLYFSWPIAFLVTTVLGGVLGVALAHLQSPRRKKNFRTVLIRGVLTGIIVGALYAIGVNVLPIHPTATAGEALTFAVAAVAGFVGLKL